MEAAMATGAEMTAAVAAAAAGIAAANVWLVVICWRQQTVLGGILGAVGLALVALAVASGLTGNAGEDALAIAIVLLIFGAALYGLSRAFDRLLGDGPEENA
jgi:hypothetical protein